MTRTALALSPHLDDAAFSCGGTIVNLTRRRWRVIVATVFTASVPDPRGFALACQLDKGLGPEVDYMALRRDEDAAAMEALGAEPVWLPFREAPHRGYGDAPALFAGVRPEDGIADDLAPAIAGLLAERRPDIVLLPQCVGGHVDHVQVVRAFDRVGWDGPALWWRDFPYVARDAVPKEPLRGRIDRLPTWDFILIDEEVDAKRRACLAYASQLGFQFGGREGLERHLAADGHIEHLSNSGDAEELERLLSR